MNICPHFYALGDPIWSLAALHTMWISLKSLWSLVKTSWYLKMTQMVFSHSPNIFTLMYRPQLFSLPQISPSPPKVIQVQTAPLTPYVKDLSHSVSGQDQHSMMSHHELGCSWWVNTLPERTVCKWFASQHLPDRSDSCICPCWYCFAPPEPALRMMD